MFLARGATCESTVFFFCDSRRRFLCLDVCPPLRPPGSDVHAARRFFRFSSLCVSVSCGFCSSFDAASPLLYVCFVIVFFICLSSACMHSPSDLVFSVWPPPAREHCADPPGKTLLHTGPAAPQSPLLSPCLINRP